MIVRRGIGRNRQIGQEAPQQEPRTVFLMDQKGVFTLPTKSGQSRKGFSITGEESTVTR